MFHVKQSQQESEVTFHVKQRITLIQSFDFPKITTYIRRHVRFCV
jgi:hypothetical protein